VKTDGADHLDRYATVLLSGRYSRHVYYSGIFASGFAYSLTSVGAAVSTALPALMAGVVQINVLFLSSLILNNIHDAPIDAVNGKANTLAFGTIPTRIHLRVVAALVAVSCLFALARSPNALAITLLIQVTAYLYSCPPARLKRFFLLNTAVIALATVLAVLLGYVWAPGADLARVPWGFLVVLFVALTLAFHVKDINDLPGDKAYGIATMVTVFGEKTGRRICAGLALCGYLTVSVAARSQTFLHLSLLPATATVLAILIPKKKISEPLIFLFLLAYAAAFLYLIALKPVG